LVGSFFGGTSHKKLIWFIFRCAIVDASLAQERVRWQKAPASEGGRYMTGG
jgi:hypothetical protein